MEIARDVKDIAISTQIPTDGVNDANEDDCMKSMHAPIALFVYNRPWHTQQTVEALLNNAEAAESDLIIFSDGPKDESFRVLRPGAFC